MPVKPFIQERSNTYQELVRELAAEWSKPNPQSEEPVILEERGRDQRIDHVYVVWSKWASVDRTERSEIIVDAAEKVMPLNDALNITLAMGLTPDEAKAWGLKF